MEASELLESPAQHVAHGAHLVLRQAGQRHQLGGDGEGVDAARLARVEVGADAAALIVGMLFEQRVDLLPFDGDEACLAAVGEIADGLVGVACHHEGGVQSAVTEPLQPVVGRGGDDGGKALGLPAHGIEQGLAGDVLAGARVAQIDPFSSMSARVLMLLLALASRVSDS